MSAGTISPETEQPQQDPAAAADPVQPDTDEDFDDEARSLPPSMIRSYGISDSTLSGPSSFGPGATSIGNLHFNARAERRFTNQPLDSLLVQDQIAAHVVTRTQQRLVNQINRNRLAYQSGPLGSGRLTAALVALAAIHQADRIAQVWFMDQQPLHSYFGEPDLLRKGFGHVVQLADTVKVEPSELAQLCKLVREKESSIVFIGASGLRDRDLVEYLVEHEPPSPQEVFLRWLDRRLRYRGTCVGGCGVCAGECVPRYVGECRDRYAPRISATTMTDAVRFAEMFAEKVPHGSEAEDLLADWDQLRVKAISLLNATAVPGRETVGEHRSRRLALHQRAARVSYAVFDGYPLTRVFAATESLIRQVDGEARRPPLGRTVLEHDLDTLLGDMRVGASAGSYDDLTGVARTAQLRQPGLVRTILDVAWHEFDSARRPLLDWLDDLVDSGDDARPVAAATGLLCGYDFDQVHDQLLRDWAASETRRRRVAAALACEMAVRQRNLTKPVLNCVAGWVNGSACQRDTAVRTYATDTFLTHYPLDALSVFEQTARDNLQRTGSAIPTGVERIYRTRPVDVMHRLIAWSSSDYVNVRTMASRCLVPLADLDVRGHGKPNRPSLLWLTRTGQIQVEEHAALWPTALLHPATGRRAWSALERWVDCAAQDSEAMPTLHRLLEHMLQVAPVRTRMRFHVRYFWRKSMPDNPLLNDIDRMLEELT